MKSDSSCQIKYSQLPSLRKGKYWETTFKEAFCQHYACPLESYERKALMQFFFPHALLLVPIMALLGTPLIRGAQSFIQRAGQARDAQELVQALNEYYSWLDLHSRFWGRTVKIRISGERVLSLLPLLREKATCKEASMRSEPIEKEVPA